MDSQWFLHDSIFQQTLENNNLLSNNEEKTFSHTLNFEYLFKQKKKKKEKDICFVIQF